MKIKALTVILVAVLNLFILFTRIDIGMFLVVILLSLFLFLTLFKNTKLANFVLLTLTLLLVFFSLKKEYDTNLFKLSGLETYTASMRYGYISKGLGRLFSNRLGIAYSFKVRPVLSKFTVNMFSHLDFNSFFKTEKLLSIMFLPFFVLGILNIIKYRGREVLFYFSLVFLIGGFLVAGGNFGRAMLLPLINICISIGLLKSLKI